MTPEEEALHRGRFTYEDARNEAAATATAQPEKPAKPAAKAAADPVAPAPVPAAGA